MSNGSAGEFGAQSTEWYSIADDSMMIDAVGQNKCAKCGSKKHATSECQTDVSKLTCFRCFPSHGEYCGAALFQHVLLVNPRSS